MSLSNSNVVKRGEVQLADQVNIPSKRTAHEIIELEDYGRASPEGDEGGDADQFGSTAPDKLEMRRMGKQQEMRRVFRQISLLSFTCILMSTWEYALVANSQGLTCGGRAGLFWSYLWTYVGYAFIAASLAEMASMAPTAGGQYHWVSEFAPPKYQKILSYCSGWLATLSWHGGNATGGFVAGTIIQGLIVIYNPNYAAPDWQGTLLVWPIMILCTLVNIFGGRWFPAMNNGIMIVHICGFIAVVVILCVLAPHVDAKTALLEFTNEGGWSSMGLALMIGQLTTVVALGASDSAAHMSEEVRDAGLTVPRAMFYTYLGNGLMGFVLMTALVFSIPSVDDALNDPTGYPFLYVFQQAMPPVGVIIMSVVMLVLVVVGDISYQASTARQTFAFARDKGLPFHRWIGKIDPKRQLPVNAVIVCCGTAVLMSCIYIGSSDAFNAILSVAVVAQMGTYAISITCVLHRRLTDPGSLPKSRWTLGRYGVFINTVAICYAWLMFFWCFWPNATPVDASSFNYAPVMFMGVLILSGTYYFTHARHSYDGPVAYTEGWRQHNFPGQMGGD